MMKARVLVVDDNENIRSIVKGFLRESYSIAEAGDGLQAWKIVSRSFFHYVISDIQIPRMTGLELSRRIKGVFPEITIILMSGSGEVDRREALNSGAEYYLIKPFSADELLRALRHRRSSPPDSNLCLAERKD